MKMPVGKHTRTLVVVIVVAAIAAVALWPEAIEVDLAPVERGPMQVTIDEEGETRVVERFVVSAPVAGRLQRIELEPGDPVVRGRTVVARLTPSAAPLLDPRTRTELSAAVAAAGAAVEQARAERGRNEAVLERARSAARRDQRLTESPGGSRNQPFAATVCSMRSSKPFTALAKRGTSFASTVRMAPPSFLSSSSA